MTKESTNSNRAEGEPKEPGIQSSSSHRSTESSLTSKTFSAAIWNALGAAGRLLISTAGMLVLVRLVSPQSFGVFAVVSTVIILIAYMSEIGSSWALVQRAELTPAHAGAAIVIAAAIAIIGTLALWVLAAPLAAVMRMPGLTAPLLMATAAILFQALAGAPRALLRRDLHFKRVVSSDLISATLGASAGIIHASFYPSVWSLVIQLLVARLANSALLWFLAPHHRIGMPSRQAFNDLSSYTKAQSAYEFFMVVAKSLDTFILGHALGANALGLYSRAFSLMYRPVGQFYTAIGTVVFSALAKVQHRKKRLLKAHLDLVTLTSILLAFPLISLGIFAKPVTEVLLGEEWLGVAPLMAILSIAASIQVLYANCLWILQATANLKPQTWSGALTAIINIGGFVLGAVLKSMPLFAWSYVASSFVAFIITYVSIHVALETRWRMYGRPAVMLLGGCSAMLLIKITLASKFESAQAQTTVLILGLAALLSLYALVNRRTIKNVVGAIRSRRSH